MKPLFSGLYACRDEKGMKSTWVSIPTPVISDLYSIGLICDRINFESNEKNKDIILAYGSSIGIKPDISTDLRDVEYIAENLSKLTPEQIECLKDLIQVFDLTFDDMEWFINFLNITQSNKNIKKSIKTKGEIE